MDEEAGGEGGAEKEQVVEVILEAGDALTAKEALLQVGRGPAWSGHDRPPPELEIAN